MTPLSLHWSTIDHFRSGWQLPISIAFSNILMAAVRRDRCRFSCYLMVTNWHCTWSALRLQYLSLESLARNEIAYTVADSIGQCDSSSFFVLNGAYGLMWVLTILGLTQGNPLLATSVHPLSASTIMMDVVSIWPMLSCPIECILWPFSC